MAKRISKFTKLKTDIRALEDEASYLRQKLKKAHTTLKELSDDYATAVVIPAEYIDMYTENVESIVLVTLGRNESKYYDTYCTGFVIGSRGKTVVILTSSHPLIDLYKDIDDKKMLMNETTVRVDFVDKDEDDYDASILSISFEKNLMLLHMKTEKSKPCLEFEKENNGAVDEVVHGAPIWSISNPHCYDTILTFSFTKGDMSHWCTPVSPTEHLHPDTSCLMYNMPMVAGCSGAPIFNRAGKVLATHSSQADAIYFGVGLPSIKRFMISYFKFSSEKAGLWSIAKIIKKGLEKYEM